MGPASSHESIIDAERATSEVNTPASRQTHLPNPSSGASEKQIKVINHSSKVMFPDPDFPVSLLPNIQIAGNSLMTSNEGSAQFELTNDNAQLNFGQNLAANSLSEASIDLPAKPTTISQHERLVTGLIIIFLISGFSASLSIAWTALAAVVMITGNATFFRGAEFEPTSILRHADLPLLVLISSLFIIMAGVRLTGAIDLLYEVQLFAYTVPFYFV
jgi:hypothetical protein